LSDAVERILRNVEQVDIQRLIGTMENSLATIDKLVSGTNLDKVSAQAVTLLSEIRETNRQLKEVVGGAELKSAAKDAALAASSAREIFQRAEKPLDQLMSDLPKVTECVNRVVQRLDAVSANLPETSADLRQTLQSLNRLISSQRQDIEKTVENLRSTSEAVRQFVDSSKKYPAQTLFGAPPPPSKAMGR
jgi:phospholipid/cholesterol/gamma-HCH transport system substrate-binding protein/paraquat-inducible protein B